MVTHPQIALRTTSYGGRSFFATQPIAKGIQVLACEAPFAHVVYKDYRREICAQCFAYAASTSRSIDERRTWSIRSSREGAESVWFCTDDCRIVWESGKIGPLLAEVNAILAKAQVATRKKVKDKLHGCDSPDPMIFPSGPDVQITQDYIDKAWAEAEDLASFRARLSSYCSTMNLEDMELEIARFVASAIVHRYVFDHCLIDCSPSMITTFDPWTVVLDLQSGELSNFRLRPYVLLAHLRVYAFLCHSLPKHLRVYVPTVRALLARDTGNAFGIWDGDDRDEMLGWGVWVSASYFNHSKNIFLREILLHTHYVGQVKAVAPT
jgi:SET and MYND domain-containing protein